MYILSEAGYISLCKSCIGILSIDIASSIIVIYSPKPGVAGVGVPGIDETSTANVNGNAAGLVRRHTVA